MSVYIDAEFKCHTDNPDGTYTEVETSFFDGKCQTFVEGYRCIPPGSSWTRSDGVVFTGEMIAPWKNYTLISAAQAQYEADMAELETAYQEGVNSV